MHVHGNEIPIVFGGKHYAFAVVVGIIWSILILRNNHELGCPLSHGIIYNTRLHVVTLIWYMCSHGVVIHQVERINKPYEFAISKMGNVLIVLRKLKFYLIIRIMLICLWLFLVFYVNAEETYIPVIILVVHLGLVLSTIIGIISAVNVDNSLLPSNRDRLKLSRVFYTASFSEVFCSILWLLFNIADVRLCHDWYMYRVNW